MTLSRIHHVGLVTRDVDRALRFYHDALGMPIRKDLTATDRGLRAAILSLGNSNIEILQPLDDESNVAKFLRERGEGLHHICFQSDDVAADLQAAKARGMELLNETPYRGFTGLIGFIHPAANHSVLIEFVQLLEDEPAIEPGPGPAAVLQLDHAVVAVNDLDAAGKTFRDHFDLHSGGRNRHDDLGIENVYLPIGDTQIELVTPTSDDQGNPLNRKLRESEGLFMLALTVRDLPAAVEQLRAQGVTCTDPSSGPTPGAFLSPKQASGVRIHLAEAE